MPITPGLTVAADSGRNDAFGWMRTSEPRTLFASTHVVTDGADIPLTVAAAGANPVPLSVVVTSLGTAATVLAALTWREVY